MNNTILQSLFLGAIKIMPYGNAINGFANVGHSSDLASNNLNKVLADYQSGEFWAREWEKKGASKETLQKEYPLMCVSLTNVLFTPNIDSLQSGNEEYPYTFEISMQAKCNDTFKSIGEIDNHLRCLARRFIQTLYNYRLVNAEWVLTDSTNLTKPSLAQQYVKNYSTPIALITEVDREGKDDVRLVRFEIAFTGCKTSFC